MARRGLTPPPADAVGVDLVDAIAEFATDPLGFVLFAFPWGEAGSRLHDEDGPDQWQRDHLTRLGEEIRKRDAGARLGAIQMAVASGHGVGKTGLVAWIILWFMSTRFDPALIVTANTLGQLSGKTWRELAKWHRLAINADWFQWTATTFYLKQRQDTHKAMAVPWSKEKSEAFAGAHEKDVLVIFDEASAIVDEIWTVTEGAMTTAGAIWLVFGNPTRNTGRFRECWREFRHRWLTFKVDSRNAKKADASQIQKWVDDYGEDSDFVRVRVRGEFPRAASTQLISSDLVYEAQKEFRRRLGDTVQKALVFGPEALRGIKLDVNEWAPRLLCVDVARYGSDQTVFGLRQGKTFVVLFAARELSVIEVAARAHEWISALDPDHVLVDGAGVGGGVVDLLRDMGHEIVDVNSSLSAIDKRRFHNRRAEMWWKVREWLEQGGAIPPDDELMHDLTAPEYGYSERGEKVQIESKDDMRGRGMPSPDKADTLAMSFFQDFAPVARQGPTLAEKLAAASQVRGGHSWMSH